MSERHPEHAVIDRFLDGELESAQRLEVERHLGVCSACRSETAMLRALARELNRMEAPEPPRGFDARVLDAVLPRRIPVPVILRSASRIYLAFAAAVAIFAVSLFAALGPSRAERLVAQNVSYVASGATSMMDATGIAFVDLLKAGSELLPVAGALGAVGGGLETAVLSLGPSILLVSLLTMTLATLVLFWAARKLRERGVPHVCLTL